MAEVARACRDERLFDPGARRAGDGLGGSGLARPAARARVDGRLGRSGPAGVRALHVNHHLRGPESDADETLVREHCAALGVEVTVVDATLDKRTGNLQARAREARRAAALTVAGAWDLPRIALAHTLDDQVETMLYRLGRYGGLAALRGMRPVTPPWVRPLLGVRRADTAAYCRAAGLTWAVDRGNDDPGYARTGLRSTRAPRVGGVAAGRGPGGGTGGRRGRRGGGAGRRVGRGGRALGCSDRDRRSVERWWATAPDLSPPPRSGRRRILRRSPRRCAGRSFTRDWWLSRTSRYRGSWCAPSSTCCGAAGRRSSTWGRLEGGAGLRPGAVRAAAAGRGGAARPGCRPAGAGSGAVGGGDRRRGVRRAVPGARPDRRRPTSTPTRSRRPAGVRLVVRAPLAGRPVPRAWELRASANCRTCWSICACRPSIGRGSLWSWQATG